MSAPLPATPFDGINGKPTFNEYLEQRLQHGQDYFLEVLRQNYTLGEVLVYRTTITDEAQADSFFSAIAQFLAQLRVCDGCELCISHGVFAVFFGEPLVYVQQDDTEHPEIAVTITLSDIHGVISECCGQLLEFAGCALLPVYTTTSEAIGMFPFRSAHMVEGSALVSGPSVGERQMTEETEAEDEELVTGSVVIEDE